MPNGALRVSTTVYPAPEIPRRPGDRTGEPGRRTAGERDRRLGVIHADLRSGVRCWRVRAVYQADRLDPGVDAELAQGSMHVGLDRADL
jgi:hypothetical protein